MSSSQATPLITRRNTISAFAVPSKLEIQSKPRVSSFPIAGRTGAGKACFPELDFDITSLNSLAYTSLKDLLPASVLDHGCRSPTASGCEISVRNDFVKEAAWTRLRPVVSDSRESSSSGFFLRRLWIGFSTKFLMNPVKACVRFFNQQVFPMITQFSGRVFGVFWIGRRDMKH